MSTYYLSVLITYFFQILFPSYNWYHFSTFRPLSLLEAEINQSLDSGCLPATRLYLIAVHGRGQSLMPKSLPKGKWRWNWTISGTTRMYTCRAPRRLWPCVKLTLVEVVRVELLTNDIVKTKLYLFLSFYFLLFFLFVPVSVCFLYQLAEGNDLA